MVIRSRIWVHQVIFSLGIAATAVLTYQIVLYPDPTILLLLGGAIAAIIIAWRPVVGLAAYVIVYPMVPAGESLNLLKVAMLGLTILLLGVWLLQKIIVNKRFHLKSEYRWLLMFFIFLCFSPLLCSFSNFSLVDWARDIAPLLNLLLIPIMVDYFESTRKPWLLYLIFVSVSVSMTRDILVLLDRYGLFPGGLQTILSLPLLSLPLPTLHPSIGLGLGLLMYLQNTPHKRLWLIFSTVCLIIIFLTPTRTVWITTGIISLLIMAFTSHKKFWALIAIAILVIATGWLISSTMGSSAYRESQADRLRELRNFKSDVSYQNRIEEIKQAGGLFLSSPIYGVGFGYQYDFWRPFITGTGPGFLDTNYTHCDIMYFASKGGLIGLTLFGLMLYGVGRKLCLRRKMNPGSIESAWATIAIIAVISSLIIGLSTPVFQTRSATFALVILVALGLGYSPKRVNGSVPSQISCPRF